MNNFNGINSNYDIVYHEKYGYIKRVKLKAKFIRKDVNGTHLCVIMALLLSFTLSFALTSLLTLFGAERMIMRGIPAYLYYIINMFGSAFTIGLPFAVYLAFRGNSATEYLRFKKTPFFDGTLLVLAAAGVCLLANFPSMLIMELVESAGMDGGATESVAGTNPFESVLYFLTVAVFPPLFEEFAFRGVMLSSLRKHGDGFALVVSSIAFAMMHTSISSMPFAFICGIAMGYVYLRTNNLWLSVIIHFINNANATVSGILYVYLPENTADIIVNIIFYGIILIGIIALVILLIRNKIRYKASSEIKRCISFDLSSMSKLGAYFSSFGALSMLILTAGLIVLSMLGIY